MAQLDLFLKDAKAVQKDQINSLSITVDLLKEIYVYLEDYFGKLGKESLDRDFVRHQRVNTVKKFYKDRKEIP